ncbi:MAG TPA: fibronectin type III domain-containing protein, partial [Bacteroidia bacterium]|nr:fibronectin type III domain-containing protein [Bacteroidia bacterium]
LALSLKTLSGYVEGIANLDPVNAENIIISAGMAVKKPSVHGPKLFTVKPGKAAGSVNLDSKAEKGAVYVYEMTTDPNTPTSWANIYIGKTTKFLKTGLSSGQRYYFRVAVIIKGVQEPWSPVVNVVIA